MESLLKNATSTKEHATGSALNIKHLIAASPLSNLQTGFRVSPATASYFVVFMNFKVRDLRCSPCHDMSLGDISLSDT